MKAAVSRLIWIPVCVIAGYLLLTAAHLIPLSWIHGHAATSFQQLAGEKDYPPDLVSSRKLDNFTDAVMLLVSDYPGTESAFVKAANSSYIILKDSDAWNTALNITGANPEEYTVYHDNRYWHGQQVLLRPLLLCFDYYQIRVINAAAFFSLILFLLFRMYQKARSALLPFLLSLLLLAPTAIVQSLQYSGVSYIALLSMLILLNHPERVLHGPRRDLLFLFTGIATAYLDLLTAPMITLAYPLALLCQMRGEKPLRLRTLLRCIIFWGIGYAGMWLGKWCIAWIINGQPFLQDLTDKILSRSGNTAGIYHFSRSSTVLKNLLHLLNSPYLDAAIGIYFIAALWVAFSKRPPETRLSLRPILPLLITALIPLCWIFLMANHAWIHTAFTYRNTVPSVFCILCMPGILFPPRAHSSAQASAPENRQGGN